MRRNGRPKREIDSKKTPRYRAILGCTRRGSYSAKRACFCLLSAFYSTAPSKNPSKNPCPYRNPYKVPSKSPSKKALPLKNLLRTLLRSVRLHDPLGVRPKYGATKVLSPLSRSFQKLSGTGLWPPCAAVKEPS